MRNKLSKRVQATYHTLSGPSTFCSTLLTHMFSHYLPFSSAGLKRPTDNEEPGPHHALSSFDLL